MKTEGTTVYEKKIIPKEEPEWYENLRNDKREVLRKVQELIACPSERYCLYQCGRLTGTGV